MINPLRVAELKVGFFVVVIIGLIAMLSMQASEDPGYLGHSQSVRFRMDDASGLITRSAVKMAGIDVGVIKKISLDNGKALLELSIRPDIEFHTTARVDVKPNGILGDKYVEVSPGNPSDPRLAEGGEITIVNNRASMDAILKEIGKITDSVGEVAQSLKAAVNDGGEKTGPLGRIIHNIEKLTKDLAELSEGNKEKINDIVENVHGITETLDGVLNDQGDEGFKAAWKRVSSSVAKIDRSMSNVEEITAKVNNGQGTIGRLVNDDETVESLNTAIAGVNSFVGGATKIQASIDFHSEYLKEQGLAKTTIGVRIQPGLDRYYELGVVDDPKGVVEKIDNTTIQNPGPNQAVNSSTTTYSYHNKLKFNALFAKNFYDFTIKAGLMESTGGLGFDYNFFKRSLRISADVFSFGDSPPHARAYARYFFYRGVYAIGGGDDLLNKGTYSTFIGAGIDLTNDDLKMLLTKAPL